MVQSKPTKRQFTVLTKTKVFRVAAKSIQQLTRELKASGIVWIGIHEDKEA